MIHRLIGSKSAANSWSRVICRPLIRLSCIAIAAFFGAIVRPPIAPGRGDELALAFDPVLARVSHHAVEQGSLSAPVLGGTRPAAVAIPIILPSSVRMKKPDGLGPYKSTHSPASANSNWIDTSCQVPTTLATLLVNGGMLGPRSSRSIQAGGIPSADCRASLLSPMWIPGIRHPEERPLSCVSKDARAIARVPRRERDGSK